MALSFKLIAVCYHFVAAIMSVFLLCRVAKCSLSQSLVVQNRFFSALIQHDTGDNVAAFDKSLLFFCVYDGDRSLAVIISNFS